MSQGNNSKETGRLRWASQRHPKGRPRKNTALSVLRRLSRAPSSEADLSHTGQNFGGTLGVPGNEYDANAPNRGDLPMPMPDTQGNGSGAPGEKEEQKTERRRIYFNMRLPPEECHDDGTPLSVYPRNKIRTAKYTPLTFIPKNLWLQFHNVANIYFMFIVILQVSLPLPNL